MAKIDAELMVAVKRDVDGYIKTLKAVDPGANGESYRRLHGRLCSMIYDMRAAGIPSRVERSSHLLKALPS